MTFEELKTEILNRAKVLELCPAYHAALIATDRPGLITAASELIVWSYQSDVVDDTLIEEFDDAELNAAGIYKNGEDLIDPTGTVYYLKSGNPIVTISGDNSCKIIIMGAVSLNLTVTDNGFAEVKCFDDSVLEATIANNGLCFLETVQNSEATIIISNDTALQVTASDRSQIGFTGNDNSHAIIRGFNHASLSYLLNDDATADIKIFNKATKVESDQL